MREGDNYSTHIMSVCVCVLPVCCLHLQTGMTITAGHKERHCTLGQLPEATSCNAYQIAPIILVKVLQVLELPPFIVGPASIPCDHSCVSCSWHYC